MRPEVWMGLAKGVKLANKYETKNKTNCKIVFKSAIFSRMK